MKNTFYEQQLRLCFIWSDYEEQYVNRADRVLVAAQQDPDVSGALFLCLNDTYTRLGKQYRGGL